MSDSGVLLLISIVMVITFLSTKGIYSMECSSCGKNVRDEEIKARPSEKARPFVKDPDPVYFQDVKDKIQKALDKIDVGEELILVDGFVNQALANKRGEIVIGGSVIPMVVAVGKETKQVYYFAYKGLGIET